MTSLGLEPIPDAEQPAGRSLLDEIRADYARAEAAPAHLDLAIPRSKLGVRYKPLNPGDLPDIDEDAESTRNIDILTAACDCIVVKGEHGWEPWQPYGEPVGFTSTLAELMGWEGLASARDVALKAFSTVPSPMYGVARHVTTYSEWVSGGEVAREEALLGESSASPA